MGQVSYLTLLMLGLIGFFGALSYFLLKGGAGKDVDYATMLHTKGIKTTDGSIAKRASGRTFLLTDEETATFLEVMSPYFRRILNLGSHQRVLYLGRITSEFGGNPDKDHPYPVFNVLSVLGGEPILDLTPFSPKSERAEEIAKKYDLIAHRQDSEASNWAI